MNLFIVLLLILAITNVIVSTNIMSKDFEDDPSLKIVPPGLLQLLSGDKQQQQQHRSARSLEETQKVQLHHRYTSRKKLTEKLYEKLAHEENKHAEIIEKYQDPDFRLHNEITIPIVSFTRPDDFLPNEDNCHPDSICPGQTHLRQRSDMIPMTRSYEMCSCTQCFHGQGPCGANQMANEKSGCEEEFAYRPVLVLTNDFERYNLDNWQFALEEVPKSCRCAINFNHQRRR